MPATETRPITTHGVVCGICGAAATVTSHSIIRNVSIGGYNGRITVNSSVEFMLPDNWDMVDCGDSVIFACGAHGLYGDADRGRQTAPYAQRL